MLSLSMFLDILIRITCEHKQRDASGYRKEGDQCFYFVISEEKEKNMFRDGKH